MTVSNTLVTSSRRGIREIKPSFARAVKISFPSMAPLSSTESSSIVLNLDQFIFLNDFGGDLGTVAWQSLQITINHLDCYPSFDRRRLPRYEATNKLVGVLRLKHFREKEVTSESSN